MSAKQVEQFLAVQSDIPTQLRDAMIRMHSGRSPMWRALRATRGVSQIVEIATMRDADRFVVIRWYWNDRHVGVFWRSYATLREAQEHEERTFRIDAAHLDIRA